MLNSVRACDQPGRPVTQSRSADAGAECADKAQRLLVDDMGDASRPEAVDPAQQSDIA